MNKTVFIIASLIFSVFCFENYYFSGTLIAAIFSNDSIYLFSDGRTTYNKSGKIALNNISKVHQITNKIGMLTAGVYIPELTEEIIENINVANNIQDIVHVAQRIIIDKWNLTTTKKDRRLIVFIAGYDKNNLPMLFIIDNMHKQPFSIQERKLDIKKDSFEFAVLCTNSGNKLNPIEIMTSYTKKYIKQGIPEDKSIKRAFQNTMRDIEKTTSSVGGNIYSIIIKKFQQSNPPDPHPTGSGR